MSKLQLVNILNFFVPLVSGGVLAAFGLAKRHFNIQRYVFKSWPAWIYIILSSCGALLITSIMQTIGTKMVQDEILNSILLGLFGAAIFLGVINEIPISKTDSNGIDAKIFTIRDFIFAYLDKSIKTKETEVSEQKINQIVENVNPLVLKKEAFRLVGGMNLDNQERIDLLVSIDKDYFDNQDYHSVIRKLVTHYRIDYIFEEMMTASGSSIGIKRKIKVNIRRNNRSGLSDFEMATMYAIQKEPEESLSYLKMALQKNPSIANDISSNHLQWIIFAGMTNGAEQQDKLNEFLELLHSQSPSLKELRRHCQISDAINNAAFLAVKKCDGCCVKISIQYLQDQQNDAVEWSVVEEEGSPQRFSTFDDIIDYIYDNFIPTKLIPTRVLIDTSEVRKVSHGTEPFGLRFKLREPLTKLFNNLIKR